MPLSARTAHPSGLCPSFSKRERQPFCRLCRHFPYQGNFLSGESHRAEPPLQLRGGVSPQADGGDISFVRAMRVTFFNVRCNDINASASRGRLALRLMYFADGRGIYYQRFGRAWKSSPTIILYPMWAPFPTSGGSRPSPTVYAVHPLQENRAFGTQFSYSHRPCALQVRYWAGTINSFFTLQKRAVSCKVKKAPERNSGAFRVIVIISAFSCSRIPRGDLRYTERSSSRIPHRSSSAEQSPVPSQDQIR